MEMTDYDKEATEGLLLTLLSFEEGLEDVTILGYEKLKYGGWFFSCRLFYEDGFKTDLPVIYYEGNDWVITPMDWDAELPSDAKSIGTVRWRIDNDSEAEVFLYESQPVPSAWIDEIEIEKMHEKRADLRKRLGKQLKDARTEKGLSLRDASALSGVDKNIISRTEAGRANSGIDAVNALCSLYGKRLVVVDV